MNQKKSALESKKKAVVEAIVKENVKVVAQLNGISWNCLCCIGC